MALTPRRFRFFAYTCLGVVVLASFVVRLWYPVGRVFTPSDRLPPAVHSGIHRGPLFHDDRTSSCVQETPLDITGVRLYICPFQPRRGRVPVRIRSPYIHGGLELCSPQLRCIQRAVFYILGGSWISVFHSSATSLSLDMVLPARYSYAAFLIHPVVVALQIFWEQMLGWSSLSKTLVVGSTGVFGCWLVGWAILQIPFVGHIIWQSCCE